MLTEVRREQNRQAAARWRAKNRDACRAANAVYKAEHKEELAAKRKAYRQANAERLRAARESRWEKERQTARLRQRREQGMIDPPAESGVGKACGICGRTDRRIVLDHDHSSGQIRGWLCCRCNRALGLLGDSLKDARNAVAYLETTC